MLYLLLIFIGIAAVAVYLLVVFNEVPGAISERLGDLEELPENLGEWAPDATSEQGIAAAEQGLEREVRTWRDAGGGWFGRDRLVRQVRYRDPKTGEIEGVEPDRVIKRRRVKSSS